MWLLLAIALMASLFTEASAQNISALLSAAASPGAIFLEQEGVLVHGDIFYYKRSENVSLCLQTEDARERVLQICALRTLVEECTGPTTTYRFDFCSGRQCLGQFSKEISQCLLEKSGVTLKLDTSEEETVCSILNAENDFFEWQQVPWARQIDNMEAIDCLAALPSGTVLERRVACDQGFPIIEYRVTFDSDDFFPNVKAEMRCLGIQRCGLPTVFRGELACYIATPSTDDLNGNFGFYSDRSNHPDADTSFPLTFCLTFTLSFIYLFIA